MTPIATNDEIPYIRVRFYDDRRLPLLTSIFNYGQQKFNYKLKYNILTNRNCKKRILKNNG